MTSQPTPMTKQQLAEAVQAAADAKKANAASVASRISYEQQRDAIAFSFIQADRSLSLEKAKAQADAQLAKTSSGATAAKPAAPAPSNQPS